MASTSAGPDPGFPLMLPLRGRKVLVVGGGTTAAQMVAALRSSGALVRVVAPTQIRPLTELAAQGLIEIANRQYQVRDLADAWLVFACSDHQSVNAALAFDAEQARIWCVAPQDSPPPVAAAPVARAETLALDETAAVQPGRRLLVLGGARSGKSVAAQAMLDGHETVQHVTTSENPDLIEVLAAAEINTPVLIDCLATWLSQAMIDSGIMEDKDGADAELEGRLEELLQSWRATHRHVVAVSNEVGWGVEPDSTTNRRFRDELGWLNTRLAAASDEVWLCTAGIATRLR
ncbi:MAG TPA: bifunctional adenosylcobinamide kinase/adenosylcobinamide-phosphate guanylyltransferase [Streptosporangiaceae bacterium]|nr:bifunctional adenosylcobinamide kinase/adenosylcobinamide-phosphate guanylyltransferase [Streptosporangiaceae bacterium]